MIRPGIVATITKEAGQAYRGHRVRVIGFVQDADGFWWRCQPLDGGGVVRIRAALLRPDPEPAEPSLLALRLRAAWRRLINRFTQPSWRRIERLTGWKRPLHKEISTTET